MTDAWAQTIVVRADEAANRTHSIAPPIFQTSTFWSDDSEAFRENAQGVRPSEFYTRYGTPNHEQTAAVIAQLEGAQAALLFGSGMGAFSSLAFALLKAGDHVVAQTMLYTGVLGLLKEMLSKFEVQVTFVDQRYPAQFRDAFRENTKLVFLETPSNPLLQLTDIAAICAMAKERGVLTIVDNTVATPILQRPLTLGADVVVHSATKAMGGHADVSAGAIAASKGIVEEIWRATLILGATLGPFESWLLLRGLRTLPLRVRQMDRNALAIASYLCSHPRVRSVNYPGLPSHPQHELARRQMSGFGSLLSFELDGTRREAEAFISNLKHIKLAPSLGHFGTLIMYPSAVWSTHDSPETLHEQGVSQTLLRLAAGIENPADIIEDLESALS